MTSERMERAKDAGQHEQPHGAQVLADELDGDSISFTDRGVLPDVAELGDEVEGPSPSDRAFGDALHVESAFAGPQQKQPKAPKTFQTLKKTAVEVTKPFEAKILKALRSSHIRIDPTWLLRAQTESLKVGDATGAMNTETLRAIHTRAQRVVEADEILAEGFLNGILNTGKSPLAVTGTGFEHETKNTAAALHSDKAAQAVGYADYKSYSDDMTTTTFLGVSLVQGKSDGRAHTYLAQRLRLAEEFLRGLFSEQVTKAENDPNAKLKGDALVAKLAGWNQLGGAAYDTSPAARKEGNAHQHTMGLAIDIDPSANGWVWDEHHNSHPSMDKHLGFASRLFGGRAFKAGTLDKLSDQTSTEELHAEVSTASGAFGNYLKWVKDWAKKYEADQKGTTTALVTELQSRGIKEADEAMVKDMMWFAGWFNAASYRKGMSQLTTIKMPLLVALRDVAGLAWGGTEMGSSENGDFMHFDCRDTTFGNAVVKQMSPEEQVAQAEREAAAKKASAAKKKK